MISNPEPNDGVILHDSKSSVIGGNPGGPNRAYLLELDGGVTRVLEPQLVSPVLLRAKPYCDACERYMQSKSLALLPASNTKAGHLFGKAAINRTAQEVLEAGMTDVAELVSLAAAADSPAFAAKLTLLAPQRGQAKKLSRRIDVRLVSCARCAAGRLEIQSTQVKGRQVTNTKMGQAELTRQFISDLRQQRTA